MLNTLPPGQYEIISTIACESSPQFFKVLTLHSPEERNIETERSRSVSNPGRLQRIRAEDSGDFSAALQTVVPSLEQSRKQPDSCYTHKGPDGPQLTLM